MKRWQIIYALPLEVWVEIFGFPWISREEFGKIVDQIGNFKFAEHAQFYLHEWGKRKLGHFYFDKDGLCKHVYKHIPGNRYRLEYPPTSMPENIKSFDFIDIRHFDAQTIDFLAKIKPLLTEDMSLEVAIGRHFGYYLDNCRTILTTLAPMLENGIPSLYCNTESVFSMAKEQLFCGNEKLTKLKWFRCDICSETVSDMEQQENVDFVMNWLALPNTDGPRLLEFRGDNDNGFAKQIFVAIREQFLVAKTPSPRTFAVNWKFMHEQSRLAEFHLANGIGEELHGIEVGRRGFQITRHQANLNTEEVYECIEEMTKARVYRRICIYEPTIGSLDTAMDKEKQAKQQPCSSKDA